MRPTGTRFGGAFAMLAALSGAGCVPDHAEAPTARVAADRLPVVAPAGAILHVDFDHDAPGVVTLAQLASSFGSVEPWSDGFAEGRAAIVATDRGRSLEVTYPAGSVGPRAGGLQFVVKLPAGYDELYCTYRVRFEPGFSFVRGGKLPGLVGGSRPSGGKPRDDGFSARLMWRVAGAVVQYVYSPRQTSEYGVDLPYEGASFRPGVWHTVTHRIVMNTPGRADGIIQGWFDGRLALDKHDAMLRLDASLRIDALYFSTFFGGNDPSWGAKRDEHVDFDDFVISTTR